MSNFPSMTLAAAVASIAALGSGIAFAQVQDSEADRGAVVTDEVPETGEKKLSSRDLAGIYAADLIGHEVQNRRSDKAVGDVSNLVIDKDGKVVAILVNRNAKKGAGSRDIAIDWKQMDRVVEGGNVTLYIDMDEEALEAMPEYARI